MTKTRISKCNCGKVQYEATHEAILVGVCYCDDCQAASQLIESLPNAPSVLVEDGGSSYLTYRTRYSGELPDVEMRTQTQFRSSTLPYPDAAPTYKKFPLSLFGKLISARIAMLFGR